MPITDPLILPADVTLRPVTEFPVTVRERLKAARGDVAMTRPRSRSRVKLIDAESAQLLEQFRSAKRVAEAVLGYAGPRGLDPDAVLSGAFPLLRDCFNGRFLVPVSSPEAAPIVPTCERGDRIGPYEVLRCVRVRSDVELYQARGPDGSPVAIKLARPGEDRRLASGFLREAAVLGYLDGIGAPRFIGKGRLGRRAWIALSWCAGVSPVQASREWRERSDPRARRKLFECLIGIAEAYARLHERSVLHGDVHHDNVLVARDGEVVLLDFGLAQTGGTLRLPGTPGRGGVEAYLSPEQAGALLAGAPLPVPTIAAEQFGLGALLYTVATGKSYVEFELERERMLHQVVDAPPLGFVRQGVPSWPELEAILFRALAKNPGDRYPEVRQLVAALRQLETDPVPAGSSGSVVPSPAPELLEAFLARVAFDGPAWTGELRSPTASLMFGAAGVAYALYRIACLRNDAALLSLADGWATRAERDASSPDAFAAPGTELIPENLGPVSPFHSVTGVHWVRALCSLAQADRRSAEAAVGRFVASSAAPCDNPELALGQAGTLLAATLLLEALPSLSRAVPALRALGDRTLDRLSGAGFGARLDCPGVAHGKAGILYAALRWCGASGTPLPSGLAAPLAGLAARAEPLGRGLHWPYQLRPDAAPMSGWCHGPAGFVHVWTLAHRRFGEPDFLTLAEAAAWSAWEGTSPGADLCCGLAGRAYGLLSFYKHTGALPWLERARQLTHRAVRAALINEPQRPLSLFKGVTGIALLEADLVRPEHAAMPCFEPEGWPASAPHE